MKVLANDGISLEGAQKLTNNGFEVNTSNVPQTELIDYLNRSNTEILLVRSATVVRKDLIDACPQLKLVGRGGVGMDNIDVEYARSKGIKVINTPAASSQSVAELVMGNLFAISRFLNDSFKNMETGDFNALKKKYATGVELRGKTLLIIGFGRIGQSLASYALGCGMNVLAVDIDTQPREICIALGNDLEVTVDIHPTNDLNEVIGRADYISLHVPKQADGSAVLNIAMIGKMKDGVRIVNAARGGSIDEDALIQGIESGKISYAALDVFENEPNPRKDLTSHAKIATTPHIGAATEEAQDRIGGELADQIIEAFGK